jgi:LemA protein
MTLLLVIVLTIIVVLGVWGLLIFNRLVRERNRIRAAWRDIDVQLQRRHDLIPRLVEAVRGYAGYERATLTAVTELRERSLRAEHLPEKAAVENQIEAATRGLIALAESYPELKASGNFLELQTALSDTENHIQYARRYYNGAVQLFNTHVQTFPDLIVARTLRFAASEFFRADDDAAQPVRVQLD